MSRIMAPAAQALPTWTAASLVLRCVTTGHVTAGHVTAGHVAGGHVTAGHVAASRVIAGRAIAGGALAAGLLLLGGCSERGKVSPATAEPRQVATAKPSDPSTTPSGVAGEPRTMEQPIERNGLLWYEDAAEAAFAAARAAGKRVVVDLWAPWCHTCLSMQSVVMTAENLPDAATRFVWLAIDTEREESSSLLERLPVSVWPTFYVVDVTDPSRVGIAGRWLGAASPVQFRRFLADSLLADTDRAPTDSAPHDRASNDHPPADSLYGDAQRALLAADDLAAQQRHAEAAQAYASALERAPSDWPRRPETLVAQMTALYKAKEFATCLRVAATGLPQTGLTASAVDFSSYALECAARVEPGDSAGGTPKEVTALQRAVAQRLQPLCEQGSAELSPDDRADACDKLAQARSALGDADGARVATLARLAVVERAADGKHGEAALTYDWARTDALLSLGRAEDALMVATERERELPDNYNPPHYRAKALKALGRWDEGLTAIDRALELAYGPRRIGLLTLQADLLFGAGRAADGLRTLEKQLAAYRALPAGQRQPAAEKRVEERLREASKPGVAPAPAR
jgi:tetratricopeptide (TPR) repeat protein